MTVGRKLKNSDIYGKQKNVVPITKTELNIFLRSCDSSLAIKRFPLMLAWACTVHKVQGNQFPEILVSFNLLKQRSFNYGQMYVALSQVISLNGLYLIGEYKSYRSTPGKKGIPNMKKKSNNFR